MKVSFVWKLLRCSGGAPCRLRHRPVDVFLLLHSDLFDSIESGEVSCVAVCRSVVSGHKVGLLPNYFTG